MLAYLPSIPKQAGSLRDLKGLRSPGFQQLVRFLWPLFGCICSDISWWDSGNACEPTRFSHQIFRNPGGNLAAGISNNMGCFYCNPN
ncbi:hypothetical protein GCG54_00010896 [Colletotrichum gloeosporioides]|uniref:Uncharacterized protein n=1 Tax=Colletotrichum gloeosporioides TaxID=474922 RepID=A0A8H4CRX7_COLGL|nr:uncharacterized protein GCG54_00010896 [Colletotrichum gloeosporioides]KAF3808707.1 hypothetical protein GCG54_00010896 [Colletotrichum gloeosporioides]